MIDPYWGKKIINPSRAVLLTVDQWGTVSNTYMQHIRDHSSLSPLLKRYPSPFGVSNGIPKIKKRKSLESVCGNDHMRAKRMLMKKYFGLDLDSLDKEIILYGFVGRITKQKGILMLLDTVEEFLHKFDFRPVMFIAGPTAPGDPYGDECAAKMHYLKTKYPNNFWADPGLLFGDVDLLNCAADWGVAPSDFEPGGIVQNEYLVASTPVIATETGGLKDTIWNFDWETREGNGLLCYPMDRGSLMWALEESVKIYNKKDLYDALRSNCYASATAMDDVGKAYQVEFYRVCRKVFFDKKAAGKDTKNYLKRAETSKNSSNTYKFWIVTGPEAEEVFLWSSFDGWRSKYSMKKNEWKNEWYFEQELAYGESYLYYFEIHSKKVLNWNEGININENGEIVNEVFMIKDEDNDDEDKDEQVVEKESETLEETQAETVEGSELETSEVAK